jgi:hypothetical protein
MGGIVLERAFARQAKQSGVRRDGTPVDGTLLIPQVIRIAR